MSVEVGWVTQPSVVWSVRGRVESHNLYLLCVDIVLFVRRRKSKWQHLFLSRYQVSFLVFIRGIKRKTGNTNLFAVGAISIFDTLIIMQHIYNSKIYVLHILRPHPISTHYSNSWYNNVISSNYSLLELFLVAYNILEFRCQKCTWYDLIVFSVLWISTKLLFCWKHVQVPST